MEWGRGFAPVDRTREFVPKEVTCVFVEREIYG
jgi:hypothetical protein